MNLHNHPFHMVTLSPWPLISSLSLMIFLIGIIKWFHEFNNNLMILGKILLILSIFQWWRDVTRESTFQGMHTINVMKLLRLGMILFIISEIFFFISFFWAFFHISLSPSIEIGNIWPPKMIIPFNPYNIPLLNTIILLSSGMSITWSHYMILSNNFKESLKSLIITIMLGIYFTFLQYMGHYESNFTISDSIFGSIFFMMTGFHGLHVIIGTLFILITFIRLNNLQFSKYHHFGFEASSWYWHFVDVVWLFLYIFIYWWSY
uniref:Cytochrome c oxidase subunit 3 n=1 Tax=Diadegma semiclausum TaxID=208481 RepID=C4N023_DIASM|nr:cytochrome c oxidase subunit III [Diadegma semiclausum]ACF35061.1 cytochrome c oxidase subunit III [Diadegma semiclausum]